MKLLTQLKTLLVATTLVLTTMTLTTTPAFAHETKCPQCKLDVVQDTKELDNEVVLRYGNKRIEYRCILCAIAQAKTKYKGDVTILAPSTVKGKPVTVKRVNGTWSADDEAVFVYQKGSHAQCETLYRAASSKPAAEAYIKSKGLKEAKLLSLKDMVELSK